MIMTIIYAYILVGVLVGGALLAWQYFYSSSGEIRGDDLFLALLLLVFWPVALVAGGAHMIGYLFSHDRVILRRKK